MAKVAIIDQNSGKKYHVQLPVNIKTAQVLPTLLKALKLPTEGAGGERMQYDMTLETGDGGKVRLEEDAILAEAGVVDGAVIRITPHMTAGAQELPLIPIPSLPAEPLPEPKPVRHFKLHLTNPDGSPLFETDFLVDHFETLITQLAALLVQRNLLRAGEQYDARIIPRTDDHPNFTKPEIIRGDHVQDNGQGFLDLLFETSAAPQEPVTYLTTQIRSAQSGDALRFDWQLDAMIGGLITDVGQYLLDSGKLASGGRFRCTVTAHEASLPNIHPAAQPKKLPKNAQTTKPKTAAVEAPISADQIIIDGVETLPQPAPQEDIEIVVDSVEELIKPEPRSIKEYANVELVGQKVEGQIPIFARRGAMARALQAASVSAGSEAEVGGFLIGSVHRDPETNELFVEVSEVVEADQARGTYLSVDFDYNSWRQVLDRIDRDFPGKFLVGWYHTHLISQAVVVPVEQPGQPKEYQALYVPFFSHMDLFIHRHFFPDAWHVALLLDLRCNSQVFYAWQSGQIQPTHSYYLYGE